MGKTAVFLMILSCVSFAQDGGEVLPAAIGDWRAASEVQVYVGDDLFLYINGGAEVHHEYGFDRVFVRDYQRGENIIAVEVYRMTNGAFGLFSFTRSSDDEPVELGNAGALSDYYLAFWGGNDLVVITAQTEFEGNRDAVLEVATKLAPGFTASGEVPEMLELLPKNGRVANSETYAVGPVVMQNVAYGVAQLFGGYEEAVAGEYILDEAEGKLLALRWDDAGAASAALEAAVERALASGGEVSRWNDGPVTVVFDNGDRLKISVTGATVRIAIAKGEHVSDLFLLWNGS